MYARAWAVLLLCASAPAWAAEVSPQEVQNRRCVNCHGQLHIAQIGPAERLSMVAPPAPGQQPQASPAARSGLYIAPNTLDKSVHAALACVNCHPSAKQLPHPQKLPKASCNDTCHKDAQQHYRQGIHGELAAKNDPNAPTCVTCHGGHDILPKSDRNSRSHSLNSVRVCGDCHQQHRTKINGAPAGEHVAQYLESVHGRSLVKGGLAVSAACNDCHGHHMVLHSDNPLSPVHRTKVAETCGQCHIGLAEVYQESIHGRKLAAGDPNAPACTGCHPGHRIAATETSAFLLQMVAECGQCHDKVHSAGGERVTSLYKTYLRSYHGQVTTLGSTLAARCSDCHGSHDIQRIEDPRSALNQENRVATCRRCHPQANASFAQFEPHGDFLDADRFPLLHAVWIYFVIVMSFAFGFFGLHSLLWLVRSVIERIKHGPHPRPAPGGFAVRRFTLVDRINHLFVIISFFGLTLTGLPLLYADQPWARGLAYALGGVRGAGLLHRFFALILIANLLVHAVGVARRFRKHGVRKLLFGPVTMLPRWKDVQDLRGMFGWFFRGGAKPRFDRWTYWEKFDYMAEVFGSLIIGLSGLLLWFPQFFAQFLPGWVFNVASIVHGYEALLAIGFIFTIHFFNAHLRLEKFPVDDVIFTGQLPEDEFRHERGEEYDRVAANGELEQLRVPAAPPWARKAAIAVGLVAMGIGITLVVFIILAGLEAL
ncbi:MAG: hypothetical protein BWX88_04189 [Planctomycetes bacterium ADurb.Bin126]|nr:MAG: hypothetical protein BWX88_04189 [Planctomycetes bacterium ADurb.Bin126]